MAAAALALSLLAGCVGTPGGSDAVADEQDPTSPYIPLAVAADEAAIDGVVLTDSFETIEGAFVELRGLGRATESDRLGRFAFVGLAPGTYTVVASRDGYAPALTTVETTAGQASSVQLFLTALASDAPYFSLPLELEGFISCGVGFSPLNPESCSAAGLNEDPNHRVAFVVPVEANLTGLVFEMVWTARGPFSGANLQARLVEPASASFEASGASPLAAVVEAENETFTAEPQNLTFDVRVAAGTHPLQGGDWSDAGGVVFEQPFTVYLTLFYRGHAVPERYTAIPEA